jgi:hypothetical protein
VVIFVKFTLDKGHYISDYLYGYSDEMNARTTTVSEKDEPDLFSLIELSRQDENLLPRLLEYAKRL